ncbi:Acyl-transf-3 domain-containing protein [Aphelenchoides besseyi]|nr:Acyl-transf-3 domain-containing protein [Aphelenchoides besseyi]
MVFDLNSKGSERLQLVLFYSFIYGRQYFRTVIWAFFVISGYLMCMLLTRQSLNPTTISDFYFRRIKRIVPTYVFVITLILAICAWKISPFEFKQIVEEAIPSLFFYSNFPNTHEVSYFDSIIDYIVPNCVCLLTRGRCPPKCRKVLFYIFVPIIIIIMNYFATTKLNFKYLFVLVVSMISFYHQSSGDSDAEHMMLSARIWQFLSGFIAHFIYDTKTLNSSERRNGNHRSLFVYLTQIGLLVLVIVLLIFPITRHHQLQRLFVILSSILIISFDHNTSIVLSSDYLVNLGDISYSVYLVHWPIFTLHRYLNEKMYAQDKEADHIVGTFFDWTFHLIRLFH